jgi:PIN domain nuclease of toxin-antitoxin system
LEGAAVILLDTHAWVWLVADPARLSRGAASAIRRARASQGIGIAAISLWELAMMFSRGRLEAMGTPEASVQLVIDRSGVIVKPLTPEVAALATQFPPDFPLDPADRLIAATARAEGLTLITRDERIRKSPLVRTIW